VSEHDLRVGDHGPVRQERAETVDGLVSGHDEPSSGSR
jgi:hypothetical protein